MSAEGSAPRRVEIEATLDRRGAEALVLELRLLARRFGAELAEAHVEMLAPPDAEESA